MRYILFILLILISFTPNALADNEEFQIYCGGNSELKILCDTQIESLYEIQDPLDIDITFPDGTDVNIYDITLSTAMNNAIGVCNYSLNGGSNISMGDASPTHSAAITVNSGNNFIDVYCRDTFNFNNSYHDYVSFYVHVASGGGGVSPPYITPIRLYKLSITGLSWNFNTDNEIEVNVIDIYGKNIDPDSVTIEVTSNITIEYQKVFRRDVGKYIGIFTIPEQNITSIDLKIVAKEGNKIIAEEFSITTENITSIDKFQDFTLSKLDTAEIFWKKHSPNIIKYFILISIFSLWLIVFYYWKRSKRKREVC